MNGDDGDGGDCREYGEEHDDDEFSGAVCGFRRGLGYPHGVDEGVRDEQEELHINRMWSTSYRSKKRPWLSLERREVHLIVKALPEWRRGHTLKGVG